MKALMNHADTRRCDGAHRAPSAFPARPARMTRRRLLAAAAAWVALPAATASQAQPRSVALPPALAALLHQGGVVLALRHANAPGTFDPPNFQAGVCSTQRNLDASGRAQARAIGAALAAQGLQPARVRSSPWCRCIDTAMLAFGDAEVWPALSSPVDAADPQRGQWQALLRAELRSLAPGQPHQAWVTHQFVLQELAGVGTASGEALVLRAEGDAVRVLGRWVTG